MGIWIRVLESFLRALAILIPDDSESLWRGGWKIGKST
jgi:hypothetical protein